MQKILIALIYGVAAVGAAGLLGTNIAHLRENVRSVNVKGLAELPVTADMAAWNFSIQVVGDDLAAVQADLDRQTKQVYAFLAEHNLTQEQVTVQSVRVRDTKSEGYSRNSVQPLRYQMTVDFNVRSTDVASVQKANAEILALVQQGVQANTSSVEYKFTGLNEIKPQLIETATRNARLSAQKFAEDSGSVLGGIQNAWQGQVEIRSRTGDYRAENAPDQLVRVVTTVNYFLKD